MTRPEWSPEAVSARLDEAITAAGGQSAVARAMGLERTTVYWWIKKGVIPEDQVQRLAPIVRKSPAWIRYGVEDPDEADAAAVRAAIESGRRLGIEESVTAMQRTLEGLRARTVEDAPPREALRTGGEAAAPEEVPRVPPDAFRGPLPRPNEEELAAERRRREAKRLGISEDELVRREAETDKERRRGQGRRGAGGASR